MKVIKVRAWHKAYKRMYAVACLGFDAGELIEIAVDCGPSAEPKEICYGATEEYPLGALVFMQGTGLKDQNGKEIYKGDVLKFVSENVAGEVCFINGAFVIGGNDAVWALGIASTHPHLFEIIGNVYEDPKLKKNTMRYEKN